MVGTTQSQTTHLKSLHTHRARVRERSRKLYVNALIEAKAGLEKQNDNGETTQLAGRDDPHLRVTVRLPLEMICALAHCSKTKPNKATIMATMRTSRNDNMYICTRAPPAPPPPPERGSHSPMSHVQLYAVCVCPTKVIQARRIRIQYVAKHRTRVLMCSTSRAVSAAARGGRARLAPAALVVAAQTTDRRPCVQQTT